MPTLYLTAHIARIYSLDWSHTCADHIVTSSQDCFVKFHNLATSPAKSAQLSLKTAVPVWKAKYTPFGDGLATVIVPQMQRNDHSLFLWNYKHLDFPVHSFFGHKDVIIDFDWRRAGHEERDLQMVTWSKDHTLRLWNVEPTTQYQCGVDPAEDTSGTKPVRVAN
jgi:WD40 repeat protein